MGNFHQAGGKIKPAKAAFHHTGGHVNPMVGMVPAHSKTVYSGPMAVPGPMVTHSNGAVVPKDTPSVATAKANFHQAGGNIKHSVGVPVVPGAYAGAGVSHTNVGVVPVDTADVKAAKVAHAAAVATAKAKFQQAGGNIDPSVGGMPVTGMTGVHHAAPVVPGTYAGVVVGHANVGVVPVDTAEVKAAKAAHAAAVATAKAKFHQAGGNIDPSVGGMSVTGMTGVHQGAPVVSGTYAGAVISHANVGVVPVDTAEVKAAKAAHVAALKQAGTYAHHGMVAHKNGAVVPVEPIDVQSVRL